MAGTKDSKKNEDASTAEAESQLTAADQTPQADTGESGGTDATVAKRRTARTSASEAAPTTSIRVATTHPAASECIQVGDRAVVFATGNVAGQRGRISEVLDPALAEQLLANPLFIPITVPADEVPALEQQLARVRQGRVASAAAADDKDRTIAELQGANRNLAAALEAARKRVAELEAAASAK